VQAGKIAEFLGEASLEFVVIEVRQVNGASACSRMTSRFADAHDQEHSREAGDKSRYFFPSRSKRKTPCALDDDRVAVIRLQQKLFFALDYSSAVDMKYFHNRAVPERLTNYGVIS